jgi:7SK snRNA methylphosphate capping enzyme
VSISAPEAKKSGKKFEYGNYNRYYGYRNPGRMLFPGALDDPRLDHFRPEWFYGKDVLVRFQVGTYTAYFVPS